MLFVPKVTQKTSLHTSVAQNNSIFVFWLVCLIQSLQTAVHASPYLSVQKWQHS